METTYWSQSRTQIQILPRLMKMLETYGVYSGYVLNIHKTQVMAFNYTPTQELIAKYNFNWHSSHIKYQIPQTASQRVNFSLKIWVEVVKRFQFQKEVKLLKWPAYDSEFIPGLLDHRYRWWVYVQDCQKSVAY